MPPCEQARDRFAVLSSQDQDHAVKAISERDKALRTLAERDATIERVWELCYEGHGYISTGRVRAALSGDA